MRRLRIIAVVMGAALSVLACAALIGAGDLSCDVGDAPSGSIDYCLGEGGVAVLPMQGDLHALLYKPDATLVGVGYTMVSGSTRFTVETFSPSGVPEESVVDPKAGSVANKLIIDNEGIHVVGGSGLAFMVRNYTLSPLQQTSSADFPGIAGSLGSAVDVTLDTIINSNVYGTSADGRFAFLRTDFNSDNGDIIVGAAVAVRAVGGTFYNPPDAGSNELTIVGNTPDASLGLAMARVTVGLAIDKSFGDGGVLLMRFADGGSARAVQADNASYWIVGQAAGATGMVVMHMNHDGTLDTTFGQGGVAIASGTNRGANAVFIPKGDNRLWLAGFDNGKLALGRVLPDAGFDPTFGDGGVVTFGIDGQLQCLTTTSDHIVAGGHANADGGTQWVLVWLVR